jgi:hypothetical protein
MHRERRPSGLIWRGDPLVSHRHGGLAIGLSGRDPSTLLLANRDVLNSDVTMTVEILRSGPLDGSLRQRV